ncbi:MAG: aminomethyl-transferring glycine dehydrogenase subunit GcvPA [Candidatus Omnitrophota bacterium]
MDYISNAPYDEKIMLERIGLSRMEDLAQPIPEKLRLKDLRIPPGLSEAALKRFFREKAGENWNVLEHPSYLGAGSYDHFIPSVVDHIVRRSEFYTSYTPYQGEASQGMLQAIFEYQTMMAELTGMDVANASLYDGASSAAEAALMALSLQEGRRKVLVSKAVHPAYRRVLQTYLRALSVEILEVPYDPLEGRTDMEALEGMASEEAACCLVQNPNFFGSVEEMAEIGKKLRAKGILFVSIVYPLSLGLLSPPGEYGADIACGEAQSFGNPLNFGGPYLGFFATRTAHLRKIPGRIVGQTCDALGERGFVLTLQTREQHIRREKATSNICTNEGLCALSAAVFLAALGESGIQELADQNLQRSHYLANRVSKLKGFRLHFRAPFFNEFVVESSRGLSLIERRFAQKGILGPLPLKTFYPELENCLLFCVTETKTKEMMDQLVRVMS